MFFLLKHKRLGMAKSKVGKGKVEALGLEDLSLCFEGFLFWSLGRWGVQATRNYIGMNHS